MKHLDILIKDMEEAFGDLSTAQLKALSDAHELYHKRASGPLPWETQVAIVVLAKSKAPVKKKVASK